MFIGIAISVTIMLVSFLITSYLPDYPLEAISTALILGIALGNITKSKTKENFTKGIKFSEKYILEAAIVLMGLKLNINYLFELGPKALVFVLISIITTISLAPVIGKLFNLNKKESVLTGVGNSICGSSAIAAFNPLLGVPLIQMGITIGVINFLGTLGIFITPLLAKLLHFSDIQSSFLIGGTLQAVGHVAAAGYSLGETVGQNAIIIKMFRVLMIGPIVLIYSVYKTSKEGGKLSTPKFPLFLIGFIIASIIATFVGQHIIIHYLLILSKTLLATAMAAIGFNISFAMLKNKGASLLYTGGSLFLIQILLAIGLIYLLEI